MDAAGQAETAEMMAGGAMQSEGDAGTMMATGDSAGAMMAGEATPADVAEACDGHPDMMLGEAMQGAMAR